MPQSGEKRLRDVINGGKRAMAAALSDIDRHQRTPEMSALLDAAYAAPRAHVIGITGPPGVGKSTLIDCMIEHWRGAGLTVGVIAVDPSSRISRGALLGDRVRMRTDPEDQGVFVRSLAARGQLGGLSEIAFPAVVLMRAVYDRVIVETVGVGQSESDIAAVADTVALCVQPASGDSMQFMKAGIMEIPHIAVVTKADLGAAASRALAELKGALSIAAPVSSEWDVPCLVVSASKRQGVAEFIRHTETHYHTLIAAGRLRLERREQAKLWLKASILSAFGYKGLGIFGDTLELRDEEGPFSRELGQVSRVLITLREA